MSSEFAARHLGPNEADQNDMLSTIGLSSLEELADVVVPETIRNDSLDLPAALSEPEALERLAVLAGRNEVRVQMIGMGYYGTVVPPVILRNVLENPGWYTAYTPYQPEISQGRLEALLDFQTVVIDLTGMEIANSSLLDEATAAAEAMALSRRVSKLKSRSFFVDSDCHPQTIEVVQTRAQPLGIKVKVGDPSRDLVGDVFGVLLQYPGSSGVIRDDEALIGQIHEAGGLVTVATDLLALVLLRPPGENGADIVVGSSQRFGVPLGFGGPHAAFMATRQAYQRSLPGRLVGVSVDTGGRQALRLALQTREQHIRREKATSNICTAQVLLAVMAAMYAVYHGPQGLRRIAEEVHEKAARFAAGLQAAGYELEHSSFFDTVIVLAPGKAAELVGRAGELGVNLRLVDDDRIGIAFDEVTGDRAMQVLAEAFTIDDIPADADSPIPKSLRRTSQFLAHPVFNSYQSETEMLRYLRRLMDKDVGLDRSMIPLGSCTMKLNATTEMIPITWPGFADIHPFAPRDQVAGYLELFEDLERWLVEITGYDAVSLQPNAGSQGEFAGLLAIRAYYADRGEGHRDVCLIPASAHGTNPASASMAGMRVVVVETDSEGNIDIEDLRARAVENADNLAVLMVTYPSTHGVFETGIVEVCDIVHQQGGQVYLDGANLNALVGVAKPGSFGADVSHLNLHKTFAIPHGGGGPGVGPIGVKEHLAPYLPGHATGNVNGIGPVAAAPWGSAGVLPISWAYIALMGSEGLRRATQVAILNANYMARRLAPHYPVLYTGAGDLVAHECIIDLRPLTSSTGVTADDVAKRLIDFGIHAPTMSFPVAGTLMIEPTESESKAELDRFCKAMIAIRQEIAQVERGEIEYRSSVLHEAPHPAEDLLADRWDRPYTREEAAYPVDSLRTAKYWVPVSRIDARYGDRNVVCACPPIDAYR